MSLVFNDTSTYKGIVQIYEKEIGANRGDVSGDSDLLKELAADVNLAYDDFTELAIKSSRTWQFDDSNQTKYPIITTNIVASQRDYAFTTDEQSNLILDVQKVLIADSAGVFHEVEPVDAQSQKETSGFWDGQDTTGTSIKYDKTANGIFLDPIPSYSYTNGLKVYISREPSYFVSGDTSKKPGVPGIFHKYFALRPAQDYIRRNGTAADYAKIASEVLRTEEEIEEYFGRRARDERMTIGVQGGADYIT